MQTGNTKRNNQPYSIDIKNKIVNDYINNLQSSITISKKYNVGVMTITRYVRASGNKMRTKKESSLLITSIVNSRFKKGQKPWNYQGKTICPKCKDKKSNMSRYCKKCAFEEMVPHKQDCKCFICRAKRGEFVGKNHPNYIDGLSSCKYTKEFNIDLKEKIRKRDNYTCQNCEITEKEHLIVLGRKLSIHHIDYNKKNCKEDNLITLCLQCNIRANKNRGYWKEYYMEKILCIQEV